MQKLFGSKQTFYKLECFVSLTAKKKLEWYWWVIFLYEPELSLHNRMGEITRNRRHIGKPCFN